MPDPLLGFSSSELLPPVQVPTVSGCQPLMPLREPPCLVATPPLKAPQRERRNTRVTLTVTSQAKRPRLQGFAPHENSTLSAGCLGTDESRCSLEASAPPGFSPSTAAPELSPEAPLMRLPQSDAEAANSSPLQGLAAEEIGLPLARPPTLLEFLAF